MQNLNCILRNFLLLSSLFCVIYQQANAQASLPTFNRFAAPNPAPTPPGDAFTLPFNLKLITDSSATTAPICAEWTRTAGPDESILITGSGFSTFADDQQGKDSRFVLADGQGRLVQTQIQRLEADKAVLTLPKDLTPWSMYLLWPANQAGYGTPIALNQTEAWWVGPDKSAPGATVSVYGRNLANRNGTLTSYVYLKPKQSASGQWVSATGVNPYRVSFQLPAGLAAGDYEVWTHNGHGGQYGWSGPLTLTVQPAPVWTSVRFDIKAYGAKGDANKDDTKAIQQALAAARQSPGSTVYFPPGVYIVNDQLDMGSNTRWQGSGKDVSVLRCGPTFSTKAFTMLYGNNLSTIELADLAIETNHSYKGNYSPLYLRGSRNVKLTNLRFSCQDYTVLDLHLSRYVFISGCEHTGISSFLGDASQLFIDRCNFRLTNDTDAALYSWGGAGVSLTNSTCQDYNNSDPTNGAGWGKGRFFLGAGNWGSNRFTYIANNTTSDLAPRPQGGVDANSGEQFLWEGNGTDWSGSPSTSTAWTITVQGFSAAYASQHQAVIIKGRGLGQSRRITGYSNGTITLETPWNVLPDPSSVIAVGNFVDRVVLYQNSIDGKAYAATSPTHVASAGIEPYGGVTNLIADGNTLRDLRSGIANWATQHAVGLDPNYFNLFANNRMLSCRWGMQNATDAQRADGTAILGTIYRKNEVRDAIVAGIANVLYPSDYPLLNGIVYEHNSFLNVPSGYTTEVHFRGLYDFSTQAGSIANQVLYDNRFSGVGAAGAAIALTPKVALRDNTFVGFSSIYAGSQFKPVLEAPIRVLDMIGDPAGGISKTNLSLWDSGTSALSWKVSSSAAWLSPVVSSGSISDERASAIVTLQANPSSLSAGEHSATVFAWAGSDQVKQFTVKFTVPVSSAVMGSINWEYWNMLPWEGFSQIPVGTKPTGSKLLDKFAAPTNFSDYYGARVRGYVLPPVDGNYVFYIAGDDEAELYLSTDNNPANKKKIAYADWTCQQLYDRYPSQQSVPIQLKAGQRYYIEALHREGGGYDYLYVGWKLPDGTLQWPIAGQHLMPYAQSGARQGLEKGVEGLDGQLNYLSNAYPNPFQEKTTIEFAFPTITDALVQVFDVQGNLIESLFKGTVDAEKKYQVEFNGSQYAGGEYICRLTCKEGVFTRKLILTK